MSRVKLHIICFFVGWIIVCFIGLVWSLAYIDHCQNTLEQKQKPTTQDTQELQEVLDNREVKEKVYLDLERSLKVGLSDEEVIQLNKDYNDELHRRANSTSKY